MIHLVSYVKGLLAGIVIGFAFVCFSFLYLLNLISIKSNDSEVNSKVETKSKKQEEPNISTDDIKWVNEAILHMSSLKDTFKAAMDPLKGFEFSDQSAISKNIDAAAGYVASGKKIEQIESDFSESLKELKDKQKIIKNVSSFLSDIVKTYSSISKDFLKLSSVALNNSSKSGGTLQQTQAMLFGSSSSEIIDPICDVWWIALTQYFNELSLDYEALSDKINNDILVKFSLTQEELSSLEKRLGSEGGKCLIFYKDSLIQRDFKMKERDKRREKVDIVLESSTPTATPIIISSTGISVKQEPSKMIQKLHSSEIALSEHEDRVNAAKEDLKVTLPKVMNDLNFYTAKGVYEIKKVLESLSQSIGIYCKRSLSISEDLKLNIEKSIVNEINVSKLNSSNLVTNRIMFLIKELDRKQRCELLNNNGNNNDMSSNKLNTLDMTSEATNYLAATSPLEYISLLPTSFENISSYVLNSESCVWFIALCGRVYRDISNSNYFHDWFCNKLAYLLNKGSRPSFIDEFVVNDVTFGKTPPILTNVKWAPVTTSSQERNLSDSTKDSEINKTKSKNYLGSLNDPEYDVSCTGDLSFKSGITFSLSTKFWINWPREHYACIPLTLILKISEVTGPVKFGVRKNCSFLSFIEEPQTRFAMAMEVGSNFNFKLTDIPHISEYIESKIRKYIRNMFVYPNAHKMRLLWPRPWWPEGTENEFLPTNSSHSTLNNEYTAVLPETNRDSSISLSVTEKVSDATSVDTAPVQPQPIISMKKKLNSWIMKARSSIVTPKSMEAEDLEVSSDEQFNNDIGNDYITTSTINNNGNTNDDNEDNITSNDSSFSSGMSKVTLVEDYIQLPSNSSNETTWFSQMASKTKNKLNEFKSKHLNISSSNSNDNGDNICSEGPQQHDLPQQQLTDDNSSPKSLLIFSKSFLKAKEVFKNSS